MSTGKISFEELSDEILGAIREGFGDKVFITDKFTIRDIDGIFREYGLGEEFPLMELIKLLASEFGKVKNQDDIIQKAIDEATKRQFELLKRQIESLQSDLNALKKGGAVSGGGSSEPSEGGDYSGDKGDYVIDSGNGEIIIRVNGDELRIPISMFVSEKKAKETIEKVNSANKFIDEIKTMCSEIEKSNTFIRNYMGETV